MLIVEMFPKEVIEKRFIRQSGRCALCGKELVFENYGQGTDGSWHAHHIDGNLQNNTLDNCACVCTGYPPDCHLNIAHLGHTDSDFLLNVSCFRLEGWSRKDFLRVSINRRVSAIRKFHGIEL